MDTLSILTSSAVKEKLDKLSSREQESMQFKLQSLFSDFIDENDFSEESLSVFCSKLGNELPFSAFAHSYFSHGDLIIFIDSVEDKIVIPQNNTVH